MNRADALTIRAVVPAGDCVLFGSRRRRHMLALAKMIIALAAGAELWCLAVDGRTVYAGVTDGVWR